MYLCKALLIEHCSTVAVEFETNTIQPPSSINNWVPNFSTNLSSSSALLTTGGINLLFNPLLEQKSYKEWKIVYIGQ